MGVRRYDALSKAELLAEIVRLNTLVEQNADVRRTVQELELHRDQQDAQAVELLAAREALSASRDRYAGLFDFAPIGYAVLDGQGVLGEVNLAAARLLGCERARLLGYPFGAFVVVRRAFLEFLSRARRATSPVEADVTLRTRDGRIVPARLTMKHLGHPDSTSASAFVMAIVDLTEWQRTEEVRRHADDERRRVETQEQSARSASEAKDRFLAMLSHELRTPLTPILFALASMKDTAGVPEGFAPTLDMIRRNIELEARLIDDLLDVTRITQGKLYLSLDTIDLHEVVEEVVVLCAGEIRAADVAVSLELSARARHVRADGTRLRQVVWNLVRNAVRNTPRGGSVSISSANEVPGRVSVAVHDTGSGISPDTLPRLFRPFEQGSDSRSRTTGLGLGLAISKGIMDAHGGSICAASDGRQRGATFTIALPTVAAPATQPAEHRLPFRAAPRPTKILLVEDNRDNATAIAELLRVHGYQVDVAGSVADALREATNGFDVLVSDIGLPDGTGRDLMQQLGTRSGGVRAIALTGYGTDTDVRKNADAGFARHLTKPIDPDDLLAAIEDLAGGNGNSAESPASQRSG